MFLGTCPFVFRLSQHTFCKTFRICKDVAIVHLGVDYSFGMFCGFNYLFIGMFILRYFGQENQSSSQVFCFLEAQLKV